MEIERIFFFLIFFSILLLIQYLVYRTFRKFILRSRLKPLTVNLLTRVPFIIFLIPYFLFIITKFDYSRLPDWSNKFIIIPFFVFQGAVIFIGLYLLAGKIIKLPFLFIRFIVNRFNFLKEKYKKIRTKKVVVVFDKSRRNFLTAASAGVAGYAFIGAGLGAMTKDEFVLEEKKVRINNLPDEMKGLIIALISDVHSGPFMDYGLMKHYADVINDMNPDLIFIPGDITNSRKNESQVFAGAFRDLKAKYGIFGTMGNHDYFSDANYISDVLNNESPIKVLRNDFSHIKINGKDLIIAGTEDTKDSGNGSNHIIVDYINSTVNKSKEYLKTNSLPLNVPKLLLVHKPYMFDQIADVDFDMMFSGHTHGGQVVIFKYADLNISFAATVNKYISGLYNNNGKYLYVSRGLGTVGLPIRLNCPPEITKITLI
ncbi:MAG: metallophosphoesterase [Ignavibacteria bacterium]|nr:metallophosphoesterase [Ignavibacteria bacterium]